jgi:hypothetical protein
MIRKGFVATFLLFFGLFVIEPGARQRLTPGVPSGLGISAAGCAPSACSCPASEPGLAVAVQTGTVQSVVISGPACAGGNVFCPDGSPVEAGASAFVPGCQDFQVSPERTGSCQIAVTLSDGTVLQKTVTMTRMGGCCAQWVADPAAWVIGPVDGGAEDAPAE